MSKRAAWDLTLLVAGIVYLDLVLFQQVEYPLFGVWFVVVSMHELIGSRRERRMVRRRDLSPAPIVQSHSRDSRPGRLPQETANDLIAPVRTA